MVLVKRPEIRIACHLLIVRLTEQRKNSRGGLAFAASEDHKRPRPLPFVIFFRAVVYPSKERPEHGGRIALRRAAVGIKRNRGAKFFRVVGADAGVLFEVQRPEEKRFVMTGDDGGIAEAIGSGGNILVFMPDERPNLPAFQSVAMAKVDEGVKIIVGHDIALPRFAKKRKHHEINFIVKQPVFEPAIKREERGVVQIRVRRALLKVERKKGDALFGNVSLLLAAGEADELPKLPAMLRAVDRACDERIQKVVFMRGHAQIVVAGEKWRQRPSRPGIFLL